LAQIAEAQKWELPQDLLRRQARSSLNRRITEMRAAGMADNEIQGRLRLLQQDVLRTTEMELKEHFVMQKIAEVEKLDVTEDDIVDEIERIADRTNESPRRIRARLEREDMLEALATELVERKALDLILAEAEYEDVVVGADTAAPVATVEAQAVPGELNEPTAPPVDEPNAEDEIKDDAGAPST
jgi:trigger factor